MNGIAVAEIDSEAASLITSSSKHNNGEIEDVMPSNSNGFHTMTDSTDDKEPNFSVLHLLKQLDRPLVNRLKYEAALFIAALPHMVPKWFLLNYAAMYLFRNLAYYRHEQGPRLKDLGFDLLPEVQNDIFSEINLYINFFTALFVVIMPVLSGYSHAMGVFGVDIYLKIINMGCVGHVLRFLTFISTSLPGPAKHCQPGAPLYRELTIIEVFTRRSRVHVDPNCGDLIFSGHMFQVTSFTFVVLSNLKYLVSDKRLRRIITINMVGTVLVQPFFIISARNHYSVDVVVSSYVAPMLWYALEGFYKTPIYKRGCVWVSQFVPFFIRSYLKNNNPCPSKSFDASALNPDVRDIVEKYNIDPSDVRYLLDMLDMPMGNSHMLSIEKHNENYSNGSISSESSVQNRCNGSVEITNGSIEIKNFEDSNQNQTKFHDH